MINILKNCDFRFKTASRTRSGRLVYVYYLRVYPTVTEIIMHTHIKDTSCIMSDLAWLFRDTQMDQSGNAFPLTFHLKGLRRSNF